ncbi:unnamed protein product [Notodromas monacha]|uniref:Calcium-activated chloride channel N-terminal domain-containing protein n=1 Tax=Notodromas monacha TaxID=399045 RepID=A0A7R9BUL5_9CRUS|nr:unnamed protein product [Notodromas monacha]CAG0921672.1 unnamed protein product [Notodromas monacha]
MIMVREWAKYRYGVFEENGFPGDPLYPSFYSAYNNNGDGTTTGEETKKPSGCSNVEIEGETPGPLLFGLNSYESSLLGFMGAPGNFEELVHDINAGVIEGERGFCSGGGDNCVFRPLDVAANQRVKSSVMNANQLQSVDQFCDAETHDRTAPTKQNVLCGGKSTWEVIKAHPDFQGVTPVVGQTHKTPVFSYRKRSPRKVVFCLDWTASMKNASRWSDVRGATYRILELLGMEGRVAAGSVGDATRIAARSASVGLVHFNSDVDIDRAPQPVNRMPISSASLISRYPSEDDSRCVTCGIRRAVHLLEQDSHPSAVAGSEIIVVAQERGIGDQLNNVERELLRKRIRVHAIVYPESPFAEIQALARRTGGKVFELQDRTRGSESPASMIDIVNAYESILQPQGTAKIYQAELKPRGQGSAASGEFQIDSGVRPPLRMTVFYKHQHGPRSTELAGPTGSIFRDFENSPLEYIADFITVLQDPLQKGKWTFRVDLVSQSPVVVEVRGQTSPEGRDAISLTTWTSWDERPKRTGSPGSSGPRPEVLPLIIYAELNRGGLAIVDAHVYAVVKRRSASGVGLSGLNDTVTVPLFDDGMGDPDIRKGDAIYSGHFTHFLPDDATYLVTVVADDNESLAKYISPSDARRGRRFSFSSSQPNEDTIEFPFCCGGSQPVDPPLSSTGPFQRVAEGRALKLHAGPKGDIYPPNRVTDLRAAAWPQYDRVTIRWTAPGGDYKIGKASLYEIRYSTNRDVVMDQNRFLSEGNILTAAPSPEEAGTQQEADAFVRGDGLARGRVYYFALRAYDGEWSPLSNVAAIALPPPSIAGHEGSAQPGGGASGVNGDYMKTPLPTVSGSNGVNASTGSICLTSLAGSDHSPQYIPASALLDEHERRQSMVRSRTPPGGHMPNNNGYSNSYSFDDGLSSTQGSDIAAYDPWLNNGVYGTVVAQHRGPPPPVAPKPTRVVALQQQQLHHQAVDLNGSRTSLRSGASTLRNVTQV